MTTYTSAINNSKTDLEGLVKHIRSLVTGGVPTNFSPTSMQVVQRGAGANMSVDVSVGDVHLVRPTSDYSFWGWQDAATNVAITTAPASNSRIDAIIAWIDTSVTNVSLNNSPGSLKFSAIVGTVAGSPVAPVDAAIQTALGSTVAWTRLANVAVGTSVTSIVNANISDQRAATKLRASVPTAAIEDSAVSTAKLATGAVSADKIDYTTVPSLRAHRVTSIQTLPTSGQVAVVFNGESWKTISGMHSTSSNPERLIATRAGVYSFSYTLNQSSGYGGGRVIVSYQRFNSAGTQQETVELWDGATDTGEPSRSFAWSAKMNLNDYLVVYVHCTTNTGGAEFSSGTSVMNAISMTLVAA